MHRRLVNPFQNKNQTMVAVSDENCGSMKPRLARAQLIDLAVAEYVSRHSKGATDGNRKIGR